MERESVGDYLDGFLRRGRECAYVEQRGYRVVRSSFRQVAETAARFARELRSRGIDKGDRVLIWGQNSAAWVAAFFGCVVAGVVVVPMDDAAAPDFALRVYAEVGAKLLVCSREHRQETVASLVLEDLPATLLGHSPDSFAQPEIRGDDILQIVFTSGTTSEPKGVVITHGNVLGNIAPLEAEIRKYLKYERFVHPLRFLNLLPLSHVFGQFLGMFLPPLMGATVIFQATLKPADVLATLKRERVSVLVGVPRILQSLKEKIERDASEDGGRGGFDQQFADARDKNFVWRWWIFRGIHRRLGWKFWALICGGAALDQETEDFWGRLGFAVIQGYGLTETTSLIAVNHPFRRGKGSIGKVLAGRQVKLAADGEILVRGAGVAAGYWGAPPTAQGVGGEDGWYRTGDVGQIDQEGNLFFKGRKKEVLVTPAGMNVYPEDLEAALRKQPEIKDCVVVGLPRDGNAEPCAVLLLRNQISPEEVVNRANQRLAEFQRMHSWWVWPEDDFPRTSTQKPRRNLIQEVVLSDLGQRSRGGKPEAPARNSLAEMIAKVSRRPLGALPEEASLAGELNLSSLDRVELLSALEDRYQLDLSETQLGADSTIADLERMLQGRLPQRVRYHYPEWVQHWPVTWIRLTVHYLLLRPAVFLLAWPRVDGREHLQQVRGPVLVICNHIDDVDVGFVLTALPAQLRNRLATAAGGEALEALRVAPDTRSWLGRMYDRIEWALGVSLLNLFPLPRAEGFRESFAYMGASVDRGYSVLVFPEGRHTRDGKMLPFRPGIGLLAAKLGIPVVPMRIDGLFEVKQAGRRLAPPGKIRIKIGAPVLYSAPADSEWIAADLQNKVRQL